MLAMFQLPGSCVHMYFTLTAAEREDSNNTLISPAVDTSKIAAQNRCYSADKIFLMLKLN